MTFAAEELRESAFLQALERSADQRHQNEFDTNWKREVFRRAGKFALKMAIPPADDWFQRIRLLISPRGRKGTRVCLESCSVALQS